MIACAAQAWPRARGCQEMPRGSIMKYLTPAAALAGLLLPAAALAATPPAVKSETLLAATGSWDGQAYKNFPAGHPQLTVLKITIPAHTKLAWHEHPEPS